MSFSKPATVQQLFAKATEFDEEIKNHIRLGDPFNVGLFEQAVRVGRYNLDSVMSMNIHFWTKRSELPLLQAYNGNLSLKDICCFGQSVEQNQCYSADVMTPDALQYAVNHIIDTTEEIQNAFIAVFGVNTSRINDGNEEQVVRDIVEIREQIRINLQPDPIIFMMNVLIFPLFNNGEPACIIILNPSGLLARTEPEERKPCVLIEIGTNEDMNRNARQRIETILDSHRITHRQGPFVGEKVEYDEVKEVLIPRACGTQCDSQFQLLLMLKKILENHDNLLEYLEGPLEELRMTDAETLLEMKEIRMRILRNIAHGVHKTGTELQRYLYERRVQELEVQERERQRKLKRGMSEEKVRGELFVCFPPIYQILQLDDYQNNY